jgi:NurA-like 5'-3' nuclease
VNDLKQTISLRLGDSDRAQVQALAARLFVRESEVYRFAISYLLNKLSILLDDSYCGTDILPLLLELRKELNETLEVRKHQLENIINGKAIQPEKYVAMCDIELLMLPRHLLKAALMKLDHSPRKNTDPEIWLNQYLTEKYKLAKEAPLPSEQETKD